MRRVSCQRVGATPSSARGALNTAPRQAMRHCTKFLALRVQEHPNRRSSQAPFEMVSVRISVRPYEVRLLLGVGIIHEFRWTDSPMLGSNVLAPTISDRWNGMDLLGGPCDLRAGTSGGSSRCSGFPGEVGPSGAGEIRIEESLRTPRRFFGVWTSKDRTHAPHLEQRTSSE